MLYRFPPSAAEADRSFLTGASGVFAKLKIESVPGKRRVLMTEHTLIFVMKGVKLLHLPDGTITASPGEVILLRKGIYVMAEYIEAGLDFEAMMIFLPAPMLQSFALKHIPAGPAGREAPCLVFRSGPLVESFKVGFREYFRQPVNVDAILPLKQQEILLLLSGEHRDVISDFIRGLPQDIDTVVSQYLFQPITIEEMAGLSNCSLAKFKRDFQERYGSAPRSWINRKRLEHAKMLLQHTDKSIADIGLECGFESASYFIRLYKAAYDMTPAAHRERAKTAI